MKDEKFEMSWEDAIRTVLAEEGRSMGPEEIKDMIINRGYRKNYGETPRNSVNSILRNEKYRELFREVGRGKYELVAPSCNCPSFHKKEESPATKTVLQVSLHDMVLACIETIGRKCFEAKELYAFAPIFKACMPHCPNLEDALKQQLDELIKEDCLVALPHDCYIMK